MITSKFNQSIKEDDYPVLKKWESLIVLFTAPDTGVVVVTNKPDSAPIGRSSNSWHEASFTIFRGEVILSNK